MKVIPRERLDFVEKLYTEGVPDRVIRARVKKKFGVKNTAAKGYLRRVKARCAEAMKSSDPEAERARLLGMALKAYRAAQIQNRNTGQPNASAMGQVTRMLAEMLGVMAPQKFEHNVRGAVPLDGLPDDVLDRLDEAAKQRAAK
ncbi:MAG TPA: hypothetical protein VLT45_27890 [Kofleriaceae bacterium]|nr:hypothetical protein [Kofleriaceae bacterium]